MTEEAAGQMAEEAAGQMTGEATGPKLVIIKENRSGNNKRGDLKCFVETVEMKYQII